MLTRRRISGICLATIVAVGAAACSAVESSSTADGASSDVVGHVHGLGIDPADDQIYVAAHGGVFRLADGRLQLVGDRVQDTMGFTVVGPNHFVASGHPAATDVDRPIHLGLIESTDAARSWRELSLAGQADFHSIERGVSRLYGYDSQSARLMASSDHKQWTALLRGNVIDLAAHPSEADSLVVATATGLIHMRGGTETGLSTPEQLVVVEWPAATDLVGMSARGTVYRSSDSGLTWHSSSAAPGMVAVFEATPDRWLVATDKGIHASTDSGQTWERLI